MVIFTVYTLCLDDNFSKKGQMDYIFGPKMFITRALMKIQTKLETFRKFHIFCQIRKNASKMVMKIQTK